MVWTVNEGKKSTEKEGKKGTERMKERETGSLNRLSTLLSIETWINVKL